MAQLAGVVPPKVLSVELPLDMSGGDDCFRVRKAVGTPLLTICTKKICANLTVPLTSCSV